MWDQSATRGREPFSTAGPPAEDRALESNRPHSMTLPTPSSPFCQTWSGLCVPGEQALPQPTVLEQRTLSQPSPFPLLPCYKLEPTVSGHGLRQLSKHPSAEYKGAPNNWCTLLTSAPPLPPHSPCSCTLLAPAPPLPLHTPCHLGEVGEQ